MPTDVPPQANTPDGKTPVRPTPPARKRRGFFRRWLRRFFFLFVAILVALPFVWFIDEWRCRRNGTAQLQAVIAEINATDPDWHCQGLIQAWNQSLPPSQNNTADQVVAASKLVAEAEFESFTFLSQTDWRKRTLGELPSNVQEMNQGLQPSQECYKVARKLQFHEGSGLDIQPPTYNNLLFRRDELIPFVRINRVLEAFAYRNAVRGQTTDSLDDIKTMLHVQRAMGNEPLVTSRNLKEHHVRLALEALERTLALAVPTEKNLAEVQEVCTRELAASDIKPALRMGRALFSRTVEDYDAGRVTLQQLSIIPLNMDFVSRVYFAYDWRNNLHNQTAGLECCNQLLKAYERPIGPERWQMCDQIQRQFDRSREDTPWTNPELRFLLRQAVKYHDYEFHSVALLRSAIVALACERYRLKTGAFPKSLADIPKELLATIPDDPFTGKPLLYVHNEKGIVVYSVGTNKIDNQGETTTDSYRNIPLDVGFRVLNLKNRRQMPKVEPKNPQ